MIKIAILSPIAWRTPPRHYGPWESVASNITEELVKRGHDVTLYATGDSKTAAKLKSVCPQGYEENPDIIPKVWESLHISNLFEEANQYDIIHNHFDFLPLTYSAMTTTSIVTTIHGFSSPGIIPVYQKYKHKMHYVSISDSDRAQELNYAATVHHGLDIRDFTFKSYPEDYLLYFGRIHPDKGTHEAIQIAKECGMRLVIAGIIQDQQYFLKSVKPELARGRIDYIGSVGPKERNTLLGNARVLLHPIYFEEPFGLSVIESMACGTPVIAYNRGSMPELIIDRKTGYLVENVKEAVVAVKNVDQIKRIDCRTHVENHFTIEKMVSKYEDIYENILTPKLNQILNS
ncbi:MAG: glycosyltransferase family 4 protein [Balneolaceae bacterium]